jgi:hypothetical protein
MSVAFRSPWAVSVVGLLFLTSASPALAELPTAGPGLAKVSDVKIPDAFDVVRTGRAFGDEPNTTFPSRRNRDAIFGVSITETKSRQDGYLDTARARDGHVLWARRGTDDGDESITTFTFESREPFPTGAVLQLVAGFVTPDPKGYPGGLGSAAFYRGKEIWQRHLEAWLAIPKERIIIRPADKTHYPLVPAEGQYDPSAAARAQWVVFVSKCKETESACVYYGPPATACSRSRQANEHDGLDIIPRSCSRPLNN